MTSRFNRRQFRGKTARQIREEFGMGLQESGRMLSLSMLLDGLDRADSLSEVKSIVAQFITLQTGVE